MPLGPSIAVYLWEVSAYERLKITKHHRRWRWQSCLLINVLRLVHVQILVNAQKCNYGKIFLKSLAFIYRWTLKPKNSHSLAIFSSTVRLREVIFSPVDLQMGVHVHVREVSASRFKCRILVEKLPEQQFSVCL